MGFGKDSILKKLQEFVNSCARTKMTSRREAIAAFVAAILGRKTVPMFADGGIVTSNSRMLVGEHCYCGIPIGKLKFRIDRASLPDSTVVAHFVFKDGILLRME